MTDAEQEHVSNLDREIRYQRQRADENLKKYEAKAREFMRLAEAVSMSERYMDQRPEIELERLRAVMDELGIEHLC